MQRQTGICVKNGVYQWSTKFNHGLFFLQPTVRPGLWDWLLWVAVLCRIGQSSGIKKRLQENIGLASSAGINLGVQNSFFFFCSLSWYHLHPFALYLQQFGTRICCFAWFLLHWAMFAFHFACYLQRFGTSTSHLHGICYILVLQTFMWVSWEFL